MSEGGVNEILDGEVGVGGVGDDEGVFPGGFGEEGKVGTPRFEKLRCFGSAGEDDSVDFGCGDEPLADFVVGAGEKLQGVPWNAGLPEAFHHFPGSENGFRCWFDDNGISGCEGGKNSTARDGTREVPGRRDDNRAERSRSGAVEKVLGRNVLPVVVGEIGCFGNFDVGFERTLLGFMAHYRDEATAGGF